MSPRRELPRLAWRRSSNSVRLLASTTARLVLPPDMAPLEEMSSGEPSVARVQLQSSVFAGAAARFGADCASDSSRDSRPAPNIARLLPLSKLRRSSFFNDASGIYLAYP